MYLVSVRFAEIFVCTIVSLCITSGVIFGCQQRFDDIGGGLLGMAYSESFLLIIVD